MTISMDWGVCFVGVLIVRAPLLVIYIGSVIFRNPQVTQLCRFREAMAMVITPHRRRLCVHLFIYPSIYPFIYLYIYLSGYLYICIWLY